MQSARCFSPVELLLLDSSLQSVFDLDASAIESSVRHVLERRAHTFVDGDLSNACAHQTCAEDRDVAATETFK